MPNFSHGGNNDHSSYLAYSGQWIEFYHLVSNQNVLFKAFVTDYNDDFTSEWSEEDAYGRMDPIASFKRTKRSISLTWDMPAASPDEAQENLRKKALMYQMLYPSYENVGPANIIKSPPIFKAKFMNLINNYAINGEMTSADSTPTPADASIAGLMGYFTQFNIKPDFDPGVFVIDGNLFPKLLKASCKFTVLHQEELGWDSSGSPRNNFYKFPYGSIPEIIIATREENIPVSVIAEDNKSIANSIQDSQEHRKEEIERERNPLSSARFGSGRYHPPKY